jgi:hypothetical protein
VLVSMPCSMTCRPTPRSQPQHVVELRAAGLGAAGVVDVDVVASDACALQRVDLMIWVLVSGRDAGVAEEHVSKIRDGPASSS